MDSSEGSDADQKEMLSGWDVMPHNSSPSTSKKKQVPEPESAGFFASLSSTKWMGQLYNMVQRFPSDPPTFTDETISFLGRWENLTAEERKNGVYDKKREMYRHAARFLDYVSTKLIWFSYRRDFPLIPSYDATSDLGWGCLVRTTQMMLARVLTTLHEDQESLENKPKAKIGRYQIIEWFCDVPSSRSPYSIHNIIKESIDIFGTSGERHLSGGEWFSPTRVAVIFEKLVNRHPESGIKMVVSKDTVIYIEDVETLCLPRRNGKKIENGDNQPYKETDTKPESNQDNLSGSKKKGEFIDPTPILVEKIGIVFEQVWQPVWILVPSLLGLGKTNEIYLPHLQHLLSSLSCVGIIGGKPHASLYFIGVQGKEVFYLDPHLVQDAVKPGQAYLDANALNTYKCGMPQSMHLSQIDPSMAIGIFCPTQLDWETFKKEQMSFEESQQPLIFCLGKKGTSKS